MKLSCSTCKIKYSVKKSSNVNMVFSKLRLCQREEMAASLGNHLDVHLMIAYSASGEF